MNVKHEISKQLANHNIRLNRNGYLCSKFSYDGRGWGNLDCPLCVEISYSHTSLSVSLSCDGHDIIQPSYYKLDEISQDNIASVCCVVANDYHELVKRAKLLTTPM